MKNITITSLGPDKGKRAFGIYKQITGLDTTEAATNFASVVGGQQLIVPMGGVSNEVFNQALQALLDAGVEAHESDDGVNVNPVPLINSSEMSREETMQQLLNAGEIAKKIEELSVKIPELTKKIASERSAAESLRSYIPPTSKLSVREITLLLICCLSGFLGIIPVAIILFIVVVILAMIRDREYKEKYMSEHKDENNRKADAYIAEHVNPLQDELQEIRAELLEINTSQEMAQAKEFVGEDNFIYGIIMDLYNLVKSKRADTLKEALNLYDGAQHRARMEEMQMAIQNASEISAAESVKQTAYARDTANSSQQAAAAAKANAYNTSKIARNTKNIDKNTRRFR